MVGLRAEVELSSVRAFFSGAFIRRLELMRGAVEMSEHSWFDRRPCPVRKGTTAACNEMGKCFRAPALLGRCHRGLEVVRT